MSNKQQSCVVITLLVILAYLLFVKTYQEEVHERQESKQVQQVQESQDREADQEVQSNLESEEEEEFQEWLQEKKRLNDHIVNVCQKYGQTAREGSRGILILD